MKLWLLYIIFSNDFLYEFSLSRSADIGCKESPKRGEGYLLAALTLGYIFIGSKKCMWLTSLIFLIVFALLNLLILFLIFYFLLISLKAASIMLPISILVSCMASYWGWGMLFGSIFMKG